MNSLLRLTLKNLFGVALSLTVAGSVHAEISIFNADSAGEGLNDNTPVSPVTGNTGTTLGQQRLQVFQAAANQWSSYLNNTQPILVQASMNSLPCGASSGVLGGAGATTAARDFANAPVAATFYPIALAQELSGQALVTFPEIVAEFNSDVGSNGCLQGLSWWYGIGGDLPSGHISFYGTVLHEIAHGLGFFTYVDSNGGRLTTANGQWNDHYMLHLADNSTGKGWPLMTDSERALSSRNSQLVWSGAAVTAASGAINVGKTAAGLVQMYAPSSYQEGSSVSHWDVDLSPDELMEPFASFTSIDTLTEKLFCDIGWPALGCGGNVVVPTPEPEVPVVEERSPFIYRMLNTLLPAFNAATEE